MVVTAAQVVEQLLPMVIPRRQLLLRERSDRQDRWATEGIDPVEHLPSVARGSLSAAGSPGVVLDLEAGDTPTDGVAELVVRGWAGDGRRGEAMVPSALLDLGRALELHPIPVLTPAKTESVAEAQLWVDTLAAAEDLMGLPLGLLRVGQLVETVGATVDLDAILAVWADRVVHLRTDPDDYLFSLLAAGRLSLEVAPPPDVTLAPIREQVLGPWHALVAATADRHGLPVVGPTCLSAVYDGTDLFGPLQSLPTGEITVERIDELLSTALEFCVRWMAGETAPDIDGRPVTLGMAEVIRTLVWRWHRSRLVLVGGRHLTTEVIVDLVDRRLEQLADRFAESPGGRNRLARSRNLLVDASTGRFFQAGLFP